LSSAIKALEEQLGVQLVRRGSRYQGLTPEGERVLDWARRIVGDARAMQAEMAASRKGVSGLLRLGVIPTAMPRIAELTGPFLRRHPNAGVSILSRSSDEIRDQIEALELDAGVTYLDSEPLGRVQSRPLYRETYCLVSRDAETGPVDWTEAAGRPLCLLTPDMQNRRIVTRHLLEAGADAMPRVESTSMLAILSHVASGDWAAILPQSLAQGLPLPHGVRARPLAGAGHMVGLVTARREPHPPLVDALLKAADSIDDFNQ
jgi:DNA-binding transcriptional LysR family regulator